MPEHGAAFRVVADALGGTEPVGLCWPVLHEFIAVVTNSRIFRHPTPTELALEQVEDWIASPRAVLLHESGRHIHTLREQVLNGRVAGPVIHDARVAALCLDHGVRELLTSDRDFTRFPLLRVRNPLV
jgi:toxin-antitoxin system PIN domain toxin